MSLNPYWLVLWVLSRQTNLCENWVNISTWNCVITTIRKVSSVRIGWSGLAWNCCLYSRTGVGFSFCSSCTILLVEMASSLCRWEEKSRTLRVIFRQSCRVMRCFLVTSSLKCFRASLVPTSPLISAYSRFREDAFMKDKLQYSDHNPFCLYHYCCWSVVWASTGWSSGWMLWYTHTWQV